MIEILWSNGKVDRAETWQGLLDSVRADQPRSYTEAAFRKELGRRAKLWAGFRIDTSLPPGKLFQELSYAKLIVILRTK